MGSSTRRHNEGARKAHGGKQAIAAAVEVALVSRPSTQRAHLYLSIPPGEHAGRECRGGGALRSPLPVPSARGDRGRGSRYRLATHPTIPRATILPPTSYLSTPLPIYSLSRLCPRLLSSTQPHAHDPTSLHSSALHPLRPSRRTPPRCSSYAARRMCTRGAM